MPSYKLTYFNITGRAEPIRYAFHIGGIPFTDEKLNHGEWGSRVKKDEYPFAQLPVLSIDGVMLAESQAILRYVGRLTGLYPNDLMEAAKVDMMLGVAEDIGQPAEVVILEKDATKKEERRQILVNEKLPKMFGYLERYLASNGSAAGYCVGEKLTVADLQMHAILGWVKMAASNDIVDKYKCISRLYVNVEKNEKVAEWNKTHTYPNL